MEGLRQDGPDLHGRLRRPALPAASAAEPPAAQSGRVARRAPAHLDQHDGELHHEHELAVLRRRDDDVVPEPDGRTGGSELRLGRARDGRARRGNPRLRAPPGEHDRELLGRSLPVDRVHPLAARLHPRGDPRHAGRRPDLRRTCHRDNGRGWPAGDRARPGRDADRDQAARHERRRLLQLELLRPLREPDPLLELFRAALDPADPGRAGLHVRADGQRANGRRCRSSARCWRCS